MAKVEFYLIRRNKGVRWPPIFVIGPPRAGTTLFYQLMVQGLRLSYLCNLAAGFPKSPGVLTYLLGAFRAIRPPYLFDSDYGETKGWNAPNQGRQMWARWFGSCQAYFGAGCLSHRELRELQGTIRLLECSRMAPFVNKSQGHSVRLLPLHEAFPQAVFVRLHRDPLFIARSILRGREKYSGNREKWFSAMPSNWQGIQQKQPLRQICEQIYSLEADMSRDCMVSGEDRVFHVHYEELCNAPAKVLDDFVSFYLDCSGIKLAYNGPVPPRFQKSCGAPVGEEDLYFLRRYLIELFGEDSAYTVTDDALLSNKKISVSKSNFGRA